MQNGLNIEVDLYNALKTLKPEEEPRVINTSVYIGTRLLQKDVVEHNFFVSFLMDRKPASPLSGVITRTVCPWVSTDRNPTF